MKTISTLLTLFIAFNLSAQITVVEKNVKVSQTENGIFLTVPYGDKKVFEKAFKRRIKKLERKTVNKSIFFSLMIASLKKLEKILSMPTLWLRTLLKEA